MQWASLHLPLKVTVLHVLGTKIYLFIASYKCGFLDYQCT